MEGWNPSANCDLRHSCTPCRSGWVPFPPPTSLIRRNALLDAIGRMSNPCERPARYPPCCDPVPKFRLPQETPICDINCYREEQAEAKMKEEMEKNQQGGAEPSYACCPPTLDDVPPENKYYLQDQKFKTNYIAGYFNPDDNKTFEQREREKCDPYFKFCGPNPELRPYPCRGVIDWPVQRWVSVARMGRSCFPIDCDKSIYQQPEYIQKQEELRRQREEMEQQERERLQAMEELEDDRPKWCADPCAGTGRY